MTLSRKAILLAGAAFYAPLVQAQDVVQLDTIRVESDAAQDALGNTVISEEEMAERNAASADELFAGQSEILATGGAVVAQKVMVHGIEESNLAVTIDGARQNKGAFHHTGNVPIDPYLLKQVQVSSGLAPADAGPGALAGVIAYETKDAADLLEDGNTFGGVASLAYNSNGNGFRRNLAVFGLQGGFEYLLGYSHQTGDDYVDGSGKTIGGTEPELTDYFGKFAYTSDSGKRIEFSAENISDKGMRPFQGGFARPDFEAVPGRPTTYLMAVTERTSYALTYSDENPDGALTPTIQLAFNEQYVDVGTVKGRNTSLSGKIENDFYVGSGVLTAGVDFFVDEATPIGPVGTTANTYASVNSEKVQSIGVYAQMRQDVGDRLSLSYGFRADSQTFTSPTGQKWSDSGLSANASADVILSDQLTLNVGAASVWGGYELNEASLINLQQLRGGVLTNSFATYATPTTSRANNARIGLRFEQGPLTLAGALFHTEITGADDPFTAAASVNTITSQGVDLSMRHTASRGYFEANWTYADVKTNGSTTPTTGYYVGRPVGHIIGLSGAYDVTEEIRIGGTAEIALKNDAPASLGAPYSALPGYEVVNLWATYKPKAVKNLEVRFDIKNVFDETYSGRGNDGVGFANVVPLTEPGRSFGIMATMRF
ncbi:TonB-dependent receptor domain-containing protein [Pseudooceanicola onchidii]|uniref:TonB-dependent receptor domain-containing protein n=1 Tax=Pseudooceanicola onchidii TaxID=2562279 RepID=UPI0010AA6B3F|nr:TonB-dependent receptor [Pseudooceanicola onchidii]